MNESIKIPTDQVQLPPKEKNIDNLCPQGYSTISIAGDFRDVTSFIMEQNNLQVVGRLRIKNCSKEEIKSLTVSITTDPDFATPWRFTIDSLMPEEEVTLSDVEIQFCPTKLFELPKKILGTLSIVVSDERKELARLNHVLSFLSVNEWSGVHAFPELIAALVTPEHPYIDEIVNQATLLLDEWTGSSSFTGYQRNNPDHVKEQMAAIYSVLRKEAITFSMPPASFEKSGHTIQLCEEIKHQKRGNCLDLALLYAGCLEKVGLHPLIVLMEGHAFIGCWLEEDSFSESIQDELAILTEKIAQEVNEICVVETTAVTTGNLMNFESAILVAENHLQTPEDFVYLIDVKRSRKNGVQSIPERIHEGFTFKACEFSDSETSLADILKDLNMLEGTEQQDPLEITKQQLWERKLLDLSLRNSLLNFRVRKSSIQLLVNSLEELEKALSSGEEFQITHCPQNLVGSKQDQLIVEKPDNDSTWSTLIKSEFQNKRIRTYLNESSLCSSLSKLYRQARTSMEENGANTLYLALGFLKWYENNLSEKPRYAPLVMIPVEIIRKSAQKGYVFRLREEEPQFNVTLLEMLRLNFGMTTTGFDPLPMNDQGVDLENIFDRTRQMIAAETRWQVSEIAFMGIFSFSQFIMWNDIRNRVEDLKRNKVVKSLVSGQMEWESKISFLSSEQLDDSVAPSDLAVPISADSSQLAAVYAAGCGHSFVLHGPPGTGKSQTITNIIANALYQGKSILFVAEKMAALTVVEKRLQGIGLGDFCLELHCNKARKKDILQKLDQTLNIGRIKPPKSYQEEAEAIFSLKQELNGVVGELHKPRSAGFSLYEAISQIHEFEDCPDCMTFSETQITSVTSQQYSRWKELSLQLSTTSLSCGGVFSHPLREYKNPTYRQRDREDIDSRLKEYHETLTVLQKATRHFSHALMLGEVKNFGQIEALTKLCETLLEEVRIPPGVMTYSDLHLWEEKILKICASGQRRDEIKKELSKDFLERILRMDSELALVEWNHGEASWFLPKMVKLSKIAKSVKIYAIDRKSFKKEETPRVLKLVYEYQENERVIQESASLLNQLYGMIFNDGICDWLLIEKMTRFAVAVQRSIGQIAENEEVRNKSIQLFSELLDNKYESFVQGHRSGWREYTVLMKKVLELESDLTKRFENSFDQWHREKDWIPSMLEKISRWGENLGGLRDYCSYLQVKSEIEQEGLETVYFPLEKGEVDEKKLVGTLIKNFSKALAIHTIDDTPLLSSFHGNLFSQKIERFKALNEEFRMLTKQELVARLSAEIPVLQTGVSGSSEMGILQRTIRSGGRMMSLRKLFEHIPNLLRKLTPCMLMSPISVAQYLDPQFPAFDLVVFDEASQITTSGAVGAIARGKGLVVVGDPKQLPPTSFFNSKQYDEENHGLEDLESVLDDCLALSMPQEHLLWHYRSKHESLITFSNSKYYENKLYTFPSPNNMVSQVKFVPVEGFYDRGRTRQNQGEAKGIVQEIIRRLSDPVLKTQSIGVVTFSSVQQNLIADLLEDEFSKRPDLDEIANTGEEPLFVKNLENVQGDERDVILFSIGYGADQKGRVALNFGPLNRKGGWRRLNVAVTRSRFEMMIFSVLRPEQIDLNRTRSEGIAGLKAFLEFALYGTSTLPTTRVNKEVAQGVLGVIADKIRSLGFQVHTNIGCSGYQVDIGILHPEKPNTYLLGVLCDSTYYYKSGTALDRNSIQEAVLKDLGWKISRVWILDWWSNWEKELKRIESEIEAAKTETNEEVKVENINDDHTNTENIHKNTEDVNLKNSHKKSTTIQPLVFEKMEVVLPENSFEYYEVAELPPVESLIKEYYWNHYGRFNQTHPDYCKKSNEDYWKNNEEYDTYRYARPGEWLSLISLWNEWIVKKQIERVLEAEAPVHQEVVSRRVMKAWEVSRISASIREHFKRLYTNMNIHRIERDGEVFLWNTGTIPEHYDEFRVPSSNESRRDLQQIPPEEIASGIKYILKQQFGLPREDLNKEISKLFGFTRYTPAMEKYIDAGIKIACEKRWAVIRGERVSLSL